MIGLLKVTELPKEHEYIFPYESYFCQLFDATDVDNFTGDHTFWGNLYDFILDKLNVGHPLIIPAESKYNSENVKKLIKYLDDIEQRCSDDNCKPDESCTGTVKLNQVVFNLYNDNGHPFIIMYDYDYHGCGEKIYKRYIIT